MSIVIKILISAAMATVLGHKVFKSTIKRNLRSCKQASQKERILWCDIDKTHPALPHPASPHWRKIGKISILLIHPVKSSMIAQIYNSVSFCDYGMCVKRYKTYFWDGMFLVYNKTKDKFEDDQKYSLLQMMTAELINTDEVLMSSFFTNNAVTLDIKRYPNCFMKETWNGNSEIFYSSNEDINTWLKNVIRANEINGANEDVILTQMIPRNWDSTRGIKDNWLRFVEGYKSIEEDETGKFITLPRFVLMTLKTNAALRRRNEVFTVNIIINTGKELINPFEEKSWDWIKIGNDVILKNVKPVPSLESEFPHYGIYCGLWSGGKVKMNDDVFISCPDIQHKCKANIV